MVSRVQLLQLYRSTVNTETLERREIYRIKEDYDLVGLDENNGTKRSQSLFFKGQ